MTNGMNIPADADWYTEISHPASGITHQMVEVDGTLYGRVIQDGREIVSPSTDPDATYTQYRSRVERWISNDEIGQPCRGYGEECGTLVALRSDQDPGFGVLCLDCAGARRDAESPRIPR